MTTQQAARTWSRSLTYWLGMVGGTLGVVAGTIQALFGSSIPQWSGDKEDPLPLGILTVALSLAAMALIRWHTGGHTRDRHGRLIVGVAIATMAGLCFTTVGALWLVPGPLLIISAIGMGLGPRAGNDPPRGLLHEPVTGDLRQ